MTILKNLEFYTDHSHNHEVMIDEINSRFITIWNTEDSIFTSVKGSDIKLTPLVSERRVPYNEISCHIEVESPFQPIIELAFNHETLMPSFLVIKVYGSVRNVGHKHAYVIFLVPTHTKKSHINFSELVSDMGWCKIVDTQMFTMQELPNGKLRYTDYPGSVTGSELLFPKQESKELYF